MKEDNRTVAEVEKAQTGTAGCCMRHADNMSCDCLERAKMREERKRAAKMVMGVDPAQSGQDQTVRTPVFPPIEVMKEKLKTARFLIAQLISYIHSDNLVCDHWSAKYDEWAKKQLGQMPPDATMEKQFLVVMAEDEENSSKPKSPKQMVIDTTNAVMVEIPEHNAAPPSMSQSQLFMNGPNIPQPCESSESQLFCGTPLQGFKLCKVHPTCEMIGTQLSGMDCRIKVQQARINQLQEACRASEDKVSSLQKILEGKTAELEARKTSSVETLSIGQRIYFGPGSTKWKGEIVAITIGRGRTVTYKVRCYMGSLLVYDDFTIEEIDPIRDAGLPLPKMEFSKESLVETSEGCGEAINERMKNLGGPVE